MDDDFVKFIIATLLAVGLAFLIVAGLYSQLKSPYEYLPQGDEKETWRPDSKWDNLKDLK